MYPLVQSNLDSESNASLRENSQEKKKSHKKSAQKISTKSKDKNSDKDYILEKLDSQAGIDSNKIFRDDQYNAQNENNAEKLLPSKNRKTQPNIKNNRSDGQIY